MCTIIKDQYVAVLKESSRLLNLVNEDYSIL